MRAGAEALVPGRADSAELAAFRADCGRNGMLCLFWILERKIRDFVDTALEAYKPLP